MDIKMMIPYVALPVAGWVILWSLLQFFKVRGLRSYRGVTLFLLTFLGLAVALLAARIFIMLAPISILVIEALLLRFVTKSSWAKSALISVLYTFIFLAAWTSITFISVA